MTGMDDPRLWLDLAQWVITLGIGLYVYVAGRHRATREEIAKLKKQHDDEIRELDRRLIQAEAEIEDKPTAKALHELALAITEFGGDMKGLVARMDGIADVVKRLEKVADRQESYLLNNKANT